MAVSVSTLNFGKGPQSSLMNTGSHSILARQLDSLSYR